MDGASQSRRLHSTCACVPCAFEVLQKQRNALFIDTPNLRKFLKDRRLRADTTAVAPLIDKRNYYDVLHVSRDAPVEIIRSSYKTLMQQLKRHPDLGGDTRTAALINQAHAVLTDRAKRAEYDAQLDLIEQVMPEAPPAATPMSASVRTLDPSRECIFCTTPHNLGELIDVGSGCSRCGSPLAIADNERIEAADQRAIARIEKKQDLIYYTRWPQTSGLAGRTEDISLNGLRFVTCEELVEGQRIKIVCAVLEAIADVTHSTLEKDGAGMRCVAGVSFATLRFARSIGGFVSDHV